MPNKSFHQIHQKLQFVFGPFSLCDRSLPSLTDTACRQNNILDVSLPTLLVISQLIQITDIHISAFDIIFLNDLLGFPEIFTSILLSCTDSCTLVEIYVQQADNRQFIHISKCFVVS